MGQKDRRNALEDKIARAASCGGMSGPTYLMREKKKAPKWVVKRIAVSRQFRIVDGVCIASDGRCFPGQAYWDGEYSLVLGKSVNRRIRILVVWYDGQRWVYAIPASTDMKKIRELPGLELNAEELRLLTQIADECSGSSKKKVRNIPVRNFAAKTLQAETRPWQERDYNQELLSDVLLADTAPMKLVTAAMDAQFHCMDSLEDIPRGCTNLICPSEKSRQYADSIISSVLFTNEPGLFLPGPIELSSESTERQHCNGRLAVYPRDRPSLQKYVQEENQKRMAGYHDPTFQLSTLPIQRSEKEIPSPYVQNIWVSEQLVLPEPEQLDALRAAASRFLQLEYLERCVEEWRRQRLQPEHYRQNGFLFWRELIEQQFCAAVFTDSRFAEEAGLLCSSGVGRLDQEQQRQIESVLAYYAHPENYNQKPQEKNANGNGVPDFFEHTFRQGVHKGRRFLGFSSETALLRVLSPGGLTAELVRPFLEWMQEENLLIRDKDSRHSYHYKLKISKKSCDVILLRDPRENTGSQVPESPDP